MNLSAPSWDLFITLFVIISVGYGFLMQRERIVVTMVAAYVGLAFSQVLTSDLLKFFHGQNPLLGKYFIHGNFTDSQIAIALFLLVLLLVSVKGGIDADKGKGWFSPIELILLSALTGALITSVILGYTPDAFRQILTEQSRLAMYLIKFQKLWIIAPALVLVILGFRNDHKAD